MTRVRLGMATRADASHTSPSASATREPPATARTTTAISGRYMRRSAPTSVAIGMKLDVGASVMKNQAPRNPSAGCLIRQTTWPATQAASERLRQDVDKRQRTWPAVVHDEPAGPDGQARTGGSWRADSADRPHTDAAGEPGGMHARTGPQ